MKKFITAAVFATVAITMPLTLASTTVAIAQETVTMGQFTDADSVHKGTGSAKIVKLGSDLTLELSGFKTIPGPDLKVYLVEAGNIKTSGDVKKSSFKSLGALKSPSGDQSYTIPAGTDLSKYKSVTIWCERFGVLFTSANLS